jgi:transposase-like protein
MLYRHHPTNRRLSSDEMEVAWVMYQEGRLTIREIASEMGISPGTMGVYIREYRAAIGGFKMLKSLDHKKVAKKDKNRY